MDPAAWTEWFNEVAPEGTRLEHDEGCGWKNATDTVRIAVSTASREERPDGWELYDVGPNGATWLPGYPIAQSTVLLVHVDSAVDLVIEVSARDGSTQEWARDAAIHFAVGFLARLQ